MKRCDPCGAHWLDSDATCPNCGGPLTWFRGSAAGDLMDAFAMDALLAQAANPDSP